MSKFETYCHECEMTTQGDHQSCAFCGSEDVHVDEVDQEEPEDYGDGHYEGGF